MGFFDDFINNGLDGLEQTFKNIETAIGAVPDAVDKGLETAEAGVQAAEGAVEKIQQGAATIVDKIDVVDQKSAAATDLVNKLGDKIQG